MSIVVDSAIAPATSATSLQHTLGITAEVGEDLFVIAAEGITDNLTTAVVVSDSQSNAWTLDNESSDGSHRIGIWRCHVTTRLVSGTDWVKFRNTLSHSVDIGMIVFKETAPSANPSLDKTANSSSQASGTTITSGTTAATTQNNENAIEFAIWVNNSTYTPPVGYTQIASQVDMTGFSIAAARKVLSATGTQTASATIGTAAAKGGAINTYLISSVQNLTKTLTATQGQSTTVSRTTAKVLVA